MKDIVRGFFKRSRLVAYRGTGGKVVIPEGIKEIGCNAFSEPECAEITDIVFPASLRSVENYAFAGCAGLTKLILPDSVTDIGYELFGMFTGLGPLREFQADGIPAVELLDNDWNPCDFFPEEHEDEEDHRLPPGVSINMPLVGPLLRNFARRLLSGEPIPAEIARNRTQYIRRKMLGVCEYQAARLPHSTRLDILADAVQFADSLELLQFLFQDGLVKPGDIPVLLDIVDHWNSRWNYAPTREVIWEYTIRYLLNAEPEISEV